MHWQHVELSSSSVGMGNASRSDGCVMAQMTVETAQMNFLVPAVSIMCYLKWEWTCYCFAYITIPQSLSLSVAIFFVFHFKWLKRVGPQNSVAWTVLTSVYPAPGAVMEKLTVRMELMKKPVVSHN